MSACASVHLFVHFRGMHNVTLLWSLSNTGTWVEGFPVPGKLCFVSGAGGEGVAYACLHAQMFMCVLVVCVTACVCF